MIREPARLSDVVIYPRHGEGDRHPFRRDGYPRDITGLAFTAQVLNGEVELAPCQSWCSTALGGVIRLTVDSALIAKLSRYNTLRVYDPEYDPPLLSGDW